MYKADEKILGILYTEHRINFDKVISYDRNILNIQWTAYLISELYYLTALAKIVKVYQRLSGNLLTGINLEDYI